MKMWLIVLLALLAFVKTHGTHLVLPPEPSQKPQEMRFTTTCALLSCWRDVVIPIGHSIRKAATAPDATGTAQNARKASFESVTKIRLAVLTGGDDGRHWRGPQQKQSSRRSADTCGDRFAPITDAGTVTPPDPAGPAPEKGFCNSL